MTHPFRSILALSILVIVLAACGATSGSPVSEAPSPTEQPSPSVEPSVEPAPTETPPVAAPDEWTLVHSFGDESTRWTGGEIAWGDAGFIAIARLYGGGEGGPRIVEYAMWRSADGSDWTQVAYPAPDGGGTYDAAALSGAADGSYVLHAVQANPDATETALVSLRSTDGETWEPVESGLPSDMFVQSIEQGPSGYLLVGGQGGQTNPTLWLSSDALTWELVHEFSQDAENVQLYGADGGAEGYVVIGRRIQFEDSSYERFAFASADGREWVEAPAPFGPDDQEYVWDVAVTSHGGDWMATLGDQNETITLWSSADGLEWSEAGTLQGPERSLADVGLFEEIGDELILSPGATVSEFGTPGTWSSSDGTSWSPIDLGADAFLGQLAIGEGVLAMTGTIPGSGETTTSTGGIWIRASEPSSSADEEREVAGTITVFEGAFSGPGGTIQEALDNGPSGDLPTLVNGVLFLDTDGKVYLATSVSDITAPTFETPMLEVLNTPNDGESWDMANAELLGIEEANGIAFKQGAQVLGYLELP